MSGGGGTGVGVASPADTMDGGTAEWRPIYDRLEAMLPQVEALVAARAGLEAFNKTQRESWEARDSILQDRLQQVEASRRRWKMAYIELLANPKLTELHKCDLEDLSSHEALFDMETSELKKQVKEVESYVEGSKNTADHEDTTRDMKIQLKNLKQAYETLCSNKDSEYSTLLAEKDHVWNQLKTLEKEHAALVKKQNLEAAQATEATHKLQPNVEGVQVVARNKNAEIRGVQGASAKHNKETGEKRRKFDHASEWMSMRIFIKAGTHANICLWVYRSDTIYSVKAKIFDETASPPGAQLLVFAGKQMGDGRTLADCNVKGDDTIFLIHRCVPPFLNRMCIRVKTQAGLSIISPTVMSPDATIGEIKERILVKLGIPLDQQHLSYERLQLPDNSRTLKDYGIVDYSSLLLKLRSPGDP